MLVLKYIYTWINPGHHSLVTGERFCNHSLGSEAVAPTAGGWSGNPAARWRLPIGLIPRWCPEDSELGLVKLDTYGRYIELVKGLHTNL